MYFNNPLLKSLIFFVLFSIGSFSQTTIDSEDFESGWGIWNDGGNDCERLTDGELYGNDYIRLRDNKGGTDEGSSMTTDDIDLTSFNSVDFTFVFKTDDFETGEDFWVQYSDDGGANWTSIEIYVADTDFVNGIEYNPTISIDTGSYTFSTNSQFRIRSDASNNSDEVYIDNVDIIGYSGGGGYCTSNGNWADGYNTGTRRVIFNTIDNSSPEEDNDYSDYTAISTTVEQSSTHNLSVYVNTDSWSSFFYSLTNTYVWIDWNQDGDFDDSGEEYFLGTADDSTNELTSLSALSITVPGAATIGTTRMRVATKHYSLDAMPQSCDTGYAGEVEDYSIEVIAASNPIIDVVGNGITMTDGQTVASTTDDTDFGSIFVTSGSDTHTFTIENNGVVDLSSIVVSISGDTGDFTLDTSLTTGTVSASGSTSFTITFDPTLVGTRTAQISITSNDTDRSPYTFNIEGEGYFYCDSGGFESDGYEDVIRQVQFSDIDNSSPLNENGYTDFTSITGNVEQGSSYNLTVNVGTDGDFEYHVFAWFDWNQDGDFDDASEEYDLGTTEDTDNGPTSLSPLLITVPIGATLGDTRMRMSSRYNEDPNSCDDEIWYGEVEDYTIAVAAGQPVIDVVGNGTTLTDGQTTISVVDDTDFGGVQESSGSVVHTFTIESNGALDLASIVVSISGDTGDFTLDTSSTLATVTSGNSTAFTVTFDPTTIGTRTAEISIASNDTDRNPYTFNLEGEGELYCSSYGNADNDMGISRVIIGTIDNSTSTSTATYSDYTAMSTSIEQGASEDITVQIDTDGHYSSFATVWIDWNQDGDFDDTDEAHNVGYAHNGDENTNDSPFTITVPADAVLGSTRMRVTSKWVGLANEFHDGDYDPNDPEEHRPSFDPCELDLDGEVEDYTLTVLEPTYCNSYGNTDYDTGITLVDFSTISNASDLPTNAYSDFTAISATVEQSSTHNLTVNVNTAEDAWGPYTVYTKVWIDWNQDMVFNTTDEEYDLGTATNTADGPTSLTPLSITIPAGATLGTTRMRVSTKYNSYSTSCETGFDGEVEDYTINVIEPIPRIDFDGIDDYVDFGDNHDLTGAFSIEAWILQEQTVSNGTILSKGDLDSSDGSKDYGYVLAVESGVVTFRTFNNGGQSTVVLSSSPYTITNDKWHHVAVSYNGTNAILYIDGILIDTDGTNSSLMNNSESFYIGAYYDSDSVDPVNYFDGFIDEVKIWNVGLSQTQFQEMMNQEIENSGSVRGKVVPRTISGGLLWANLIGYYHMNNDDATDSSISSIDGTPVNITTSQLQTAPLPYYTGQDGDWDATDSSTPWQYVQSSWNTPNGTGIDGTTQIDWNIVRVSNNVNVNRDLFLASLISESTALLSDEEITDSELTIGADGSDYELNISHYLKLDGKIDLQNESQLIQGTGSWLDVDSSGYVERDQQGTANSFTYNYWSAPVSLRNISENNGAFKITDVMRDGHRGGDLINSFTFNANAYFADGAASNPRKLSTYWLYRFVTNQNNDYANWEWVGNTNDLNISEGFSMKGTSGSGNIDMGVETQNYVFRGKPNNVQNGDTEIVHTSFTASFDSNGTPKVSLAGNPFLSALDADTFIDDNINSTNGQLYFWEHWGGGSHRLSAYQGGYAIYTKAGGTPAPSHPDISQVGSGAKTPSRYIPIGQGFFVLQKHDYDEDTEIYSNPQAGDVIFTNDQRIFKTEGSGESIFTKQSDKNSKIERNPDSVIKETKDRIQRIRIGFTSPDGFFRSNMMAFLDGASEGYDYGYDAVAGGAMKNDFFFVGEKGNQVIQAFGMFDTKREIPISIIVDELNQDKVQTISIESIENFSEDLNIYVKDNENDGETFDLSTDDFEVRLEAGIHKNRFSIVFQSKLLDVESLSKIDDSVLLFMNNDQAAIHIVKLADIDITKATLHNSLGQSIKVWNQNLEERNIQLPVNMSTGVYVISLDTEIGVISKKILIK